MLFDGMNGTNAGMIERGGGAGFAEETFESLGIAVRVLGKKFEGHAAAKFAVFGFIDDAHAAFAEPGGGCGNGRLFPLSMGAE